MNVVGVITIITLILLLALLLLSSLLHLWSQIDTNNNDLKALFG